MRNTYQKALADADTVGDPDKARKEIERKIRSYAKRSVGLVAPTVADVRAADREGVDVETYCARVCDTLVARCERHQQGGNVSQIADAAE